jgi:hypothetical protein
MSAFAASQDDDMPAGVAFIVKKLKAELHKRGAKGMAGLGRKFRIMDVSSHVRCGVGGDF